MSTSLKIQQPKFIDELEQVDDLYEEITKEMERIEKRIYDTKSGIRGSDVVKIF